MSNWKIVFSVDAQKDLNGLSKSIRNRIFDKLEWFEDNFDSITPLFLTGKFSGFCKLRMGDWRAIYEIIWDKNQIVIHVIGHRSDIYE